jgi:hypothetical protein
MSTLAEYQRNLRDLIKGRAGPPPGDRHLAEVAQSPGLTLIREIAVWWRTLAVEGYCPWSTRLLKRLGIFQQSVQEFYRGQNVSSYVEKAGEQFLLELSGHPHPVVAALARFELAILKVKQGDTAEYTVEWDRNPDAVFASFTTGHEVPVSEAYIYRTYISREIPGLVRCDQIPRQDCNR